MSALLPFRLRHVHCAYPHTAVNVELFPATSVLAAAHGRHPGGVQGVHVVDQP